MVGNTLVILVLWKKVVAGLKGLQFMFFIVFRRQKVAKLRYGD